MSEELDKLARKIKSLETSKDVLEILIFLKKGYVEDKNDPQIKLEIEYVGKDICPYCLNHIDWERLEKLIAKHNEELGVEKKYLKEYVKKLTEMRK